MIQRQLENMLTNIPWFALPRYDLSSPCYKQVVINRSGTQLQANELVIE